MDDLIRRQDAIEYFMTNTNWHDEEGDPIDDSDEKRALLTDYFNGVPSANPWILCSERMPEEYEWIGTKDFGTTISDEVYVTFESPDGVRFAKHLCFQNGKLSKHDQLTIDTFHKGAVPIAWKPLPDPWKGDPS